MPISKREAREREVRRSVERGGAGNSPAAASLLNDTDTRPSLTSPASDSHKRQETSSEDPRGNGKLCASDVAPSREGKSLGGAGTAKRLWRRLSGISRKSDTRVSVSEAF